MATIGSFNTKNPTMKRIMKEAAELSQNPSADFSASPLEDNIFEWHFTLRGPPEPSPFSTGLYHGRITLPPTYPHRPPSFRFLTPSGRFECNREICLSISNFHEESWQPAWGVRTALLALRGHMDVEARGQVGGIESDAETRKRIARNSGAWVCPTCQKSNRQTMEEQEALAKEAGKENKEENVPEELRLAYREDLGKNEAVEASSTMPKVEETPMAETIMTETSSPPENSLPQAQQPVPHAEPAVVQLNQQPRRAQARRGSEDAWLDTVIYGIAAFLGILLARKVLSFL